MSLEVRNISKFYRNNKALDNVSISFTNGIWGLLGPNGAGKTTLIKILVSVINDYEGTVCYCGKDIKQIPQKYRTCLGYCPQNFGTYENMTVYDFLEYIAVLKGEMDIKIKSNIEEIAAELSLTDKLEKKINTLSGGTRQRVGIAQTVLNDPDILIFDEPTVGLDIEERRKFRAYITKLSREKIIIISTHIVSDIEFISDEIVILQKGKLVKIGKIEQLLMGLDGKVWKTIIQDSDLDKYKDDIIVTNYHNYNQKNLEIRYIAEKKVLDNSVPVKPELNDYYLYCNRGI